MKAPEVDGIYEPEIPDEKVVEPDIRPRLSLELGEDDRRDLEYIESEIQRQILKDYAKAFSIESRMLEKVRVRRPAAAGGGYVTNPDGSYVEDWSQVTYHDMELFVQEASAWTFFLSQSVIDDYAEAVFAKYSYDDAYSDAYGAILTGTIADKQAKASRRTQKERWVALYKTLYFKRAKTVVDELDKHVRRVEGIMRGILKQSEQEYRAARA